MTTTTIGIETEGKGLENNLHICGINATYVRGMIAPQMYRFEFETTSQLTKTAIKRAVEKIRIAFGEYEYAETESGKGFAVIRPLPIPNTVWLGNASKYLDELITADPKWKEKGYVCFGKNVYNNYITNTLDKCKSILIAGTSGSGKSCLLNSLIMQILCFSDSQLFLIDPKSGAEFGIYKNDIHNRVEEIAIDTTDSINCLKKAVDIMEWRFRDMGKRGLRMYDGKRLVVVIDELADLMMTSKAEVEDCIVKIAQKGRAAKVSLIVATQVPYANIITGKIKLNLQTKVCLKTDNSIHSRIILGVSGGEKLLGNGDALIKFEDNPNFIRTQTPYISDREILNCLTR